MSNGIEPAIRRPATQLIEFSTESGQAFSLKADPVPVATLTIDSSEIELDQNGEHPPDHRPCA